MPTLPPQDRLLWFAIKYSIGFSALALIGVSMKMAREALAIGSVPALLISLPVLGFGILAVWEFTRFAGDPWCRPSRVKKSTSTSVPYPLDAAIAHCEHALHAIGAHDITVSADASHICAWMPLSWRSFGERIDIQIASETDKSSGLELSSDSLLPSILLDYGKNRRNLAALAKLLLSS